MTRNDAKQSAAIPCGLLEGGVVTEPVKKGQLITSRNARVDEASGIVALRKKQDEMLERL